jgi:uncharacterized protein YndB with AHSA1/START domain
MRLQLEKDFACPASLVWLHLCDTDLLTKWSGFPIRLVAAGQAGHPGGPGAHRRVYLPVAGRTVVLNEVIRNAEPPHRLTYQVVDTLPMRSHMGEIYLKESDSGCRLRWEIEFEVLAERASPLVGRALHSKLDEALDRLVAMLAGESDEAPLPTWSEIERPGEEDWSRAEATLAAQQELARKLDADGDPKRIFAHIYSFVSDGILSACRAGDFIYPSWPLRLLPVFHDYYWRNFERWCGLTEGPVESHWRRAFAASEKPRTDKRDPLAIGLVLAIHAHVESDLPRTLAEVYVDHFAESSDYERFRGDYYAMGQIFIDAFEKIQALMPQDSVPLWAKAAGRVMPQEITQQLIYRRGYDLPKHRRAAFRRGAEIATMLLARQKSEA